MTKLVLIGSSSTLTNELEYTGFEIIRCGRSEKLKIDFLKCFDEDFAANVPITENLFCINVGLLIGKKITKASKAEIINSLKVNLIGSVLLMEHIFSNNQNARIVIIGSESASKGSFDTTYFLAKAALKSFITERVVGVGQQIAMISPSTIEDSNMTQSRKDQSRLETYRKEHPKQRFLEMKELAAAVNFLLSKKGFYFCNTELQLNGGKFARMK